MTLFGTIYEFYVSNVSKMKLYVGVSLVILSLGLVLLCSFLDFNQLFDKLLGFVILISSLLAAYLGVSRILSFFDYNRIIKKGLKVKAHIVEIKRTLLSVNHIPEYIVEVFYKHPTTEEMYYTEFEYFGDVKNDVLIKKGKEIDIIIDPRNPDNIYFKNLV